jgi:hypothetical protein
MGEDLLDGDEPFEAAEAEMRRDHVGSEWCFPFPFPRRP